MVAECQVWTATHSIVTVVAIKRLLMVSEHPYCGGNEKTADGSRVAGMDNNLLHR
jgi:hypothetical protein